MTPFTHGRDERLTLPVIEGTLLWSMRTWVAALHHATEPAQRIAEIFARRDAPNAAGYLAGFMFALRHGAVRAVCVGRPGQPRISDDERALLDVFALAQDNQSFEALLVLRGFVTPAGARAAYQSAEGVAGELRRSGWLLRPPASGSARLSALAPDIWATMPAEALLH